MTDAASEVGAIFSARFRIRKQKESDAANFLIGMSIAYMGLGTLFELRLKFWGLEVSDSHIMSCDVSSWRLSPSRFPLPKNPPHIQGLTVIGPSWGHGLSKTSEFSLQACSQK